MIQNVSSVCQSLLLHAPPLTVVMLRPYQRLRERAALQISPNVGSLTCMILGGRKAATKFFGTHGRSSWTYSHLHLSLSAISDSGPICDEPRGRREA